MRVRLVLTLCGVAVVSLVGSASAHVDLVSPPPRLAGEAGGNQLKTKPCGQTNNMRTGTVTTFKPGETIQIKLKEYVDHPGYFAVAFDADGDNDFPFPRANMDDVDAATDDPKAMFPLSDKVLGFHLDAAAPKGNGNCAASADKTCTISVKLPNIQCQTCTLQVTQFMYDKVNDNNDNEYYYQCADIKLEGELMPGGGGAGGGGGTGGTAGGNGGAGGAAGSASGGTSAGTASGGTVSAAGTASGGAPGSAGTATVAGSGTGGSAAVTPPASSEDDGGCSVARAGDDRTSFAALAGSLLLGLGWFARRRNRPE
jgi:hypothetical protein